MVTNNSFNLITIIYYNVCWCFSETPLRDINGRKFGIELMKMASKWKQIGYWEYHGLKVTQSAISDLEL